MLQWRPEFVIRHAMRGMKFKVVKRKQYPPKVVNVAPSKYLKVRQKTMHSYLDLRKSAPIQQK